MALVDTTWYANAGDQNTSGHYAVAKWATGATIAAGALRRQNTAPAVGSERVFVCIVAGTAHATTEPTWVLTRGAKTVDNTVTWQECTGQAALNGDLTNTATWAQVKAATPAVLGQVIKRSNNASYQICTTAGAMSASEPAFSDTAGVTTTDTTAVWTSLGPISNFTGGQAPHARLANACAASWWAAGNTIYVGDNHAESQATVITIQPGLSQATVGRIVCHNHSGSYPPTSANLATTATISTTAVVAINITAISGALYFYGLTFICGVGQSGTANVALTPASAFYYFDSCVFKVATTSIISGIVLTTANAGAVTWNNCQVSFANAGQYVDLGYTSFIWQNTGPVLASGSTVPTNLMGESASGHSASVTLECLDLSQVTSVFSTNIGVATQGNWIVKDCKLNASTTFATPGATGNVIQYVRSDSSGTAYKSARYALEGTETTETSITRVGGASDPTGQAQSRKIVTTANSQWLRPFKAEPYAIWNPNAAANVTVTVYGTVNAGTLPNNDDIWLEVEYLGSAASPLGTIVTTTKANLLAANAAVAADGSTWNGGGSDAGWSPFKLTTTLSSPQPGLAGYIHARARAAAPGATYYLDPLPVLS